MIDLKCFHFVFIFRQHERKTGKDSFLFPFFLYCKTFSFALGHPFSKIIERLVPERLSSSFRRTYRILGNQVVGSHQIVRVPETDGLQP